MKQTLERLCNDYKERFITYQFYKFKINSNIQHLRDMAEVNKGEKDKKAPFKTNNLISMMQCLVDARNNMKNPHITHLTIYLEDGYHVNDLIKRLSRIASDEIKYLWGLEFKKNKQHIHLYLIVDIPESIENINEYINKNYNEKLKCSAIKSVYNTQYQENIECRNLRKDVEFVKTVEYASYATKQTCKKGLKEGAKTFGTSVIKDRNQKLNLDDHYKVYSYFQKIEIGKMGTDASESFRLVLTIEKLGTQTHLLWCLRDFELSPTRDPESLLTDVSSALSIELPFFIQENSLSVHKEDVIIESLDVLPTTLQYKRKTTELKETPIEHMAKHVQLIATLEGELLEVMAGHVQSCLPVKDPNA